MNLKGLSVQRLDGREDGSILGTKDGPALELPLGMVDGSRDDDGPTLGLPLGMVDGSWDNDGPVLGVVVTQELHLALHV